jgi:hypothetical protein
MSLTFQSVSPGDRFEFDPDCVLDGNYRVRPKFKCRECRANFVNRQRIVAVNQHVPTPLSHTHHEKLDLEVVWRLPLTNTSRIRFWAFSYSTGEPCVRSNQLTMYFIAILLLNIDVARTLAVWTG